VAKLVDPTRLEAFKNALANWKFEGYVQFNLTDNSYRWIRCQLDGITLIGLKELMNEYVTNGGEIDEQRETRDPWAQEHHFHYDLRFTIQGVPVYFETRLHLRLPYIPDEPWIEVVNVHAP
jgi:hypothetical protein